jgi:flagellar hook assembly protein FlgD
VLEPSGTGDGQEPPVLPKAYALYQNFPNPFNPSTRITFALPEKGAQSEGLRTRLLVYNLKGQLVQALFEGTLKPGYHTLVWDGTDRTGAPVSSGVYLYRLVAGDFEITKKMSLMK